MATRRLSMTKQKIGYMLKRHFFFFSTFIFLVNIC